MVELIRYTENLDLDVERELWLCAGCGHEIISARENYKKGCLVADRDPSEVHPKVIEGPYNFAPDGDWVRLLEFYCPGCMKQIETEYLPAGHPVTHDIELDIDSLKSRLAKGEYRIVDGKLSRSRESEA